MTKAEAIKIAGTLGEPSKMPGYSYGLPAEECITGRKLVNVKGSVCENCYALKGFYAVYPNVKQSQYKRLESITHPQWVEAMVTLIQSVWKKSRFFRWHDSGDLQSVDHLARIVRIARYMPHIKFWLPTREYKFVAEYEREYFEEGFKTFPENLVIRLSDAKVDAVAHDANHNTSGVHTDDRALPSSTWGCLAHLQSNECGSCRACWDPDVKHVSYLKH